MSILDIVALIPLAYLAVVAIPLIITDVKEHRLPNKYVVPFIGISFLTSIAVAGVSADWIRFLIVFGTAVATLLIGVYLTGADILGMGDVKLLVGVMLALGSFSTWYGLIVVGVSLLVALISTLVAMRTRKMYAYAQLGSYIITSTLVIGAVAGLT